MIQKLFLPEKIFGIRLISQKIAGLAIDEKTIHVVLAYAEKKNITILNVFSVEIPAGPISTLRQRIVSALKTVNSFLSKHEVDQINIGISSSAVLFKELTFPFKDRAKIEKVITFELESKIPFRLEDAVIDFLINEQDGDHATILALAARNQDIVDILNIYREAGISPNIALPDILAIHAVYEQIPEYAQIKEGVALVDIREHSTCIAFLQNNALRLMRTFPKGLQTLISAIHKEVACDLDILRQYLKDGSLENQELATHIQTSLKKNILPYFNEIQFTLNSYTQTLKFYGPINGIFFSGSIDKASCLISFGQEILQISCFMLTGKDITKNPNIFCKPEINDCLNSEYVIALGLSNPSSRYESINLCKDKLEAINSDLEEKQLLTGFILTSLLCLVIGVIGFWQIHQLQSHHDLIQKKLIDNLSAPLLSVNQNIFDGQEKNRIKKASHSLNSLIATTNNLLESKEDLWLTIKNRSINPLQILLDLTRTIDREQYQVTTQNISIVREKNLSTLVQIQITMSSKTIDNDWQAFTKFIQTLAGSRYFSLGEYKEEPGDIGGVQVLLPLYHKQK